MKNDAVANRSEFKKCAVAVIIGLFAGVAVSIVLLLIFAAVMSFTNIPQTFIPIMSVLAAAIGSFIGGIISASFFQKSGMLTGALCGAALSVIVLLSGVFVLNEGIGAVAFTKLIIFICSAAIGGIIGVNRRRR